MKRSRSERRRRAGFTLVEVLLVMVILVIIAGLSIRSYGGAQRKALINAAKTQVQELASCVENYNTDCRQYPASLDALVQPPADLADPTRWGGPYLQKPTIPLDPWDQPYLYAYPSVHGLDGPDISSAGPDRQPGTDDDIGNWQ